MDISKIHSQISRQSPFSLLEPFQLEDWLQESSVINFKVGQRLLRPDELNSHLYLVLKGSVRLVGSDPSSKSTISLCTRGPGQLLGWVSLLRCGPTENVIASTNTVV